MNTFFATQVVPPRFKLNTLVILPVRVSKWQTVTLHLVITWVCIMRELPPPLQVKKKKKQRKTEFYILHLNALKLGFKVTWL